MIFTQVVIAGLLVLSSAGVDLEVEVGRTLEALRGEVVCGMLVE